MGSRDRGDRPARGPRAPRPARRRAHRPLLDELTPRHAGAYDRFIDLERLAAHIVDAVPTVRGRISVRDRCGRPDIAGAVAAECTTRGLEPVVEHVSNAHLRRRILTSEPTDWSTESCRARGDFPTDVDGVIVLGGWPLDTDGLPDASISAWSAAVHASEAELGARRVPYVFVAVASAEAAAALGRSVDEIDALLEPLVTFDRAELLARTAPIVTAVSATSTHELVTPGCRLVLDRGARPPLVDDGVVDADDAGLGAVVSNLPAGSVYWTVLEHRTRGDVCLTDGSVLRFGDDGRVVDGPFAGERVSHLGVGAHPLIDAPVGWTIVDEHRSGAVFLALGENRYMGGENASDINVDLLPASPTLTLGGRIVVRDGDPAG